MSFCVLVSLPQCAYVCVRSSGHSRGLCAVTSCLLTCMSLWRRSGRAPQCLCPLQRVRVSACTCVCVCLSPRGGPIERPVSDGSWPCNGTQFTSQIKRPFEPLVRNMAAHTHAHTPPVVRSPGGLAGREGGGGGEGSSCSAAHLLLLLLLSALSSRSHSAVN